MMTLEESPKDLVFIAKQIGSWPTDANTARLDFDGEICFSGSNKYDFFPEDIGLAKATFKAFGGWTQAYTKAQVQKAKGLLSLKESFDSRCADLEATSQRLPPSEKVTPNLPTSEEFKELLGSLEDVVVPYALRSTLSTLDNLELTHKEDVKYNKKLVKAINVVLEYYSN